MKIKPILLLLCLSLVSFKPVPTEEKTISGVVTLKSDGVPLPGVEVHIKGTSKGASTDFDGKYSIKVTPGDVLVFTYVKMKPVEKTVGKADKIDVEMEK